MQNDTAIVCRSTPAAACEQNWKSKASIISDGELVWKKIWRIVFHLSGFQTFMASRLACSSTYTKLPSSTFKGISPLAEFGKFWSLMGGLHHRPWTRPTEDALFRGTSSWLHFMVRVLKKLIYKAVGPLYVDQEEWPCEMQEPVFL